MHLQFAFAGLFLSVRTDAKNTRVSQTKGQTLKNTVQCGRVLQDQKKKEIKPF